MAEYGEHGLQDAVLRQQDLQEPGLLALNRMFRDIVREINRLAGQYGPVSLPADLDLNGHRLVNAAGTASGAGVGASAPQSTVLAGPMGSDGAATFRRLVSTDLPFFDAERIISGTLKTAVLPAIPFAKLTALIIAGTTAQRPASPKLGQWFFDTTLGKPVWCKTEAVVDPPAAAVWVTADGVTA